jgi:3-isopropylmalate/(R)-2-methylmalate dehydratase large subunit
MKFVFHGALRPWVGGKDLILYTIGRIGVEGARYRTMEFAGEAIDALSVEGRLTMCNMAVEAGAKNGIVAPDDKTLDFVASRKRRAFQVYAGDPEASYVEVQEYEAGQIEPQVAFPHLPENSRPVSEAAGIAVDQVVIGSCTNGRLEDLRIAAGILKGRRASSKLRLIVIPGTQEIYLQAMREGLLEVFVEAGAAVSTPTCGPCLGGHMGILAHGERALSTTNRNFVGRMGSPESEVYLAGPAVAAASAITGYITHPEEVVRQ